MPQTSCKAMSGQNNRIPGWNAFVAPARNESLFWHQLWVDCGRPHSRELLLIVCAGHGQPITMQFVMFVGRKQLLYKKTLLGVLLRTVIGTSGLN